MQRARALEGGATLALAGRGTPLPCDTARMLVDRGRYRLVRNPMAVAGIGQGLSVALWSGSATVALYAVAGALVWHVGVRPSEDRDLEARFDDAYRRYRAAVPLWCPRPVRRRGDGLTRA